MSAQPKGSLIGPRACIAAVAALVTMLVPASSTIAADAEARLLRDVNEGPNGSAWASLAEVGERLFFVAGERGPRLYPRRFGMWVSDGTRAGTMRIHDPSDSWGDTGPRVDVIGEDDGALLFAKRAPSDPWFNPWRTDGTAAGTQPLVDETGTPVGISSDIVWIGDAFYFGGYKPGQGNVLFRAESGTTLARLVRAFSPKFSARWGKPAPVAALDDLLIFTLDDGTHGRELWASDGTAEGTGMLADIVPGKASLFLDPGTGYGPAMMIDDGRLFFQAYRTEDDHLGSWVTDGTTGGTKQVTDALLAFHPALAEGPQVFVGEDDLHGREPWVTDGTAAGTMLLQDIAPGPADGLADATAMDWDEATLRGCCSMPGSRSSTARCLSGCGPFSSVESGVPEAPLVRLGYFVADDGVHGPEPWVTDGTREGTRLLLDIDPMPGRGSDPSPVVTAAGRVVFAADDGVHGRQLWISEGDPEQTRMIASIDLADRPLPDLVALEDDVYLTLEEPSQHMSLWRIDATTEGATRIWRGPASKLWLQDVDGVLAFLVRRDSDAGTLWVTDGTTDGTAKVTAAKGRPLEVPDGLVVRTDDRLVFYGDDGKRGLELWALDVPAS